MTYSSRFRAFLLFASLLLPFVTGLAAAILKLKNGWNGQQEDFGETFFNYAMPIPVAAGCIQLFFWPATVGVMMIISMFKNFFIFIGLVILYFLGLFFYLILNHTSTYEYIYLISNHVLIVIAMGMYLVNMCRERANRNKVPN